MRVPSDSNATPQPTRSAAAPATDSKSFDRVLEKKTDARSKARALKDRKPDEPDGRNAIAPDPAALLTPLRHSESVQSTAPVAAPDLQALESLVREIHVVSGKDPSVELQFHSKTLDGLNVRIERRGDQLSIRFVTGSDSVAQLLSKHTDQLSQSLQAKGIQIGTMNVELAPSLPNSSESDQSSRRQDRGDRDQRQDRRQR